MVHLLEIKCVDSRVNVKIIASTSVQFTPTTVQVPNLAPTHTKRITVCLRYFENIYTKINHLRTEINMYDNPSRRTTNRY